MLHQVGVGALGPVFRTYEPTRDRLVAVKVFRLDVTPEQAQSLADELSVAAEAGLFHPSVVEPIAAGVEGTVAYRAEEYVAAETLDVALRHYAPASIDKVLPLVAQLAGAIDFARTSGIGHGALHPRDIFVSPEEARATGFGVVEALERVGLRAPVRRPYSAPERVAGQTWGTPADVFALAVIAYELLTGRRPAGTGSQIGAVTGGTAGHHPAAVHAVFVQAMDDDPQRRYRTALAFASALDAAARGEAPRAPAAAAGAAGLAGLGAPPDLEEAVEDLPALEDIDAQAEPVQAGQEEELFCTEDPEIDDVIAEKDDDEAHVALLREEEAEAAPAGGVLFDEEAVEDLALDERGRAGTDRFADEFSLAASQVPAGDLAPGNTGEPIHDGLEGSEAIGEEYAEDIEEPEAVDRGYDAEDHASVPFLRDQHAAAVFHDRPRPSFLSYAVTAVLALLVGFAAGHAVGKRTPDGPAAGGASDGTVAGAEAPDAVQPYSEETLTPQEPVPPVGEPPVVGETPDPAPAAAAVGETQASTGRLVVRSTPAGANVTVDGSWRGRTPLTLDEVAFGSHAIRVVQSGYAVATENVTLSAGTPSRTLSFRLQRSAPVARPTTPPRSQTASPAPAGSQRFTGSIYVDSRPRGARVLLNGEPMGTTPVRIPEVRIGSHVVRLQLADHSDWTTSARVVSGQEARITGSLERIR